MMKRERRAIRPNTEGARLAAFVSHHAHQHPPKTNIGTNAAQNHPQICHYWKPSEQIVHGSILCRFNCIHDAKEETLDIQT